MRPADGKRVARLARSANEVQGSRYAATLGYPTQPLRGTPHGNMRNRRRPCRSGFSLLEVLLAASILVGCLVVLSELAAIGRRLVQNAQTLTAAQAIGESLVNEILAGVKPPDPIEDQAVEGLPGWLVSVDTQPLRQPGLLQLRVTVKENVQGRPPRPFTLVQWLRDPETRRRDEGPSSPLPPGPRRGGGRRP